MTDSVACMRKSSTTPQASMHQFFISIHVNQVQLNNNSVVLCNTIIVAHKLVFTAICCKAEQKSYLKGSPTLTHQQALFLSHTHTGTHTCTETHSNVSTYALPHIKTHLKYACRVAVWPRSSNHIQ